MTAEEREQFIEIGRVFRRVPSLGVFDAVKLNDDNGLRVKHALEDLEAGSTTNGASPPYRANVGRRAADTRRTARDW